MGQVASHRGNKRHGKKPIPSLHLENITSSSGTISSAVSDKTTPSHLKPLPFGITNGITNDTIVERSPESLTNEEMIRARGIFKTAFLFWTKTIANETKSVKRELNFSILRAVKTLVKEENTMNTFNTEEEKAAVTSNHSNVDRLSEAKLDDFLSENSNDDDNDDDADDSFFRTSVLMPTSPTGGLLIDDQINAVSIISTVISAIHYRKFVNDCELIRQCALFCIRNDIDCNMLIAVWKYIASLFLEMYGSMLFSVTTQYCLDVSVLYVITLVHQDMLRLVGDYPRPQQKQLHQRQRQKHRTQQQLQESLLKKHVSNQVSPKCVQQLLSDLISLDFTDSTLTCLTHRFGVEYLCRYIESPACGQFLILEFLRFHSKVSKILDRNGNVSLAHTSFDDFLMRYSSDLLRFHIVTSPLILRQIRSNYRNNFKTCLDTLFRLIIEWIDNNHLSNFKQLLSTNSNKNHFSMLSI